MLSRYTLFSGRRTGDRRSGASAETFVDRYGSGLFAVAMVIVGLNVLDAYFTLHLLGHGARELNPLVEIVLEYGVAPFIVCKTLCIGLCIALLSLTKNFLVSRIGLGVVLAGYIVLLVWHLHLMSFAGLL